MRELLGLGSTVGGSWWILLRGREWKKQIGVRNQMLLWCVKFDLPFSHPSKGIQHVKVRV